MIHVVLRASKGAVSSPFAQELQKLGVPHKLLTGEVVFRYRYRIWLLLAGLPKLAWYSLRWAVRSMALSDPKPTVVVVGTHFEVLAFGLMRALGFARPRIVMLGFIYTTRRRAWLNALRRRYFRLVFSFADRVICHSSLEVERYESLFEPCRAAFVYMPYGLHIWGRPAPGDPPVPSVRRCILSAGRSGRDYATLLRAVDGLDVDVHIVCDNAATVAGLTLPPNVTLLRQCYGGDYVRELRECAFVVVPLGVDDISAGQMVLIQAMAFAKPTVITATPTIREYATDGVDALLVPQGDAAAMRAAIERLLGDPALAARLARDAETAFEEKFSMRAYVRQLVAAAGD